MPTRMKFEAATVQATRRAFGLFPGKFNDAARDVFMRHFVDYRREMKQRSTVGPLFKNTGRLGGSYDAEVSGNPLNTYGGSWGKGGGGPLKASVFSHSYYSIVHESGGTMYPPVGSTWIYIPTVYNALYTIRAHVRRAKKTVRQVRSEGDHYVSVKEFIRTYPDAKKTLSLMDFVSKTLLLDGAGVPMYTLWKRAHYQARLGFIETGAKYEQRIMDDLASAEVNYWKAT